MTRVLCCLTTIGILLAASPPVSAETHEESLQADQTQQQYTRKSMTFLGTVLERGLSVPDDVRAAITKVIRQQVELKRFDYNDIDISGFGSMDQFIAALREYVKKRAFDRAAAEAEWQDKYGSARVYTKDIDRVMSSAYFYQIEIFAYRSKPMICPADIKTAARLECAPGVAGIKSVVNAKLSFWRADLKDEQGRGYQLIQTIKEMPGKGFTPFDVQPPVPPNRPNLPANASEEQRRRAREAYERAMAAHRQAMAEYEHRLPELEQRFRVQAAVAAISGPVGLAKRLGTAMKRIPDFQLKTPVTAALSDGVEFMLGKREGLEMDDTYEVTEFNQAGKQSRIGWVKVRKIGDAQGSGEGTPSYAEKVKESRRFAGGESMIEYPMMKLDVGLHGVFEYTVGTLDPGGDGAGMYPGAGMYILYDFGPSLGWADFWVGVEGDYLALGEVLGQNTGLVHAMLGLKKKWYINSLVFTLGLRGGISYFVIDDDSQDNLIGGGADAVLGVEYYFHPRFSIYLNAAGRFFTNPLQLTGEDANPEMGAQANLGIRLGL